MSELKLWGDGPNMAEARKAMQVNRAATVEATQDQRQPVFGRRSFGAADYSRITSSMVSETDHIMRIIRYQGRTLRARARQVAMNTAYGAKFLQMVVSNVCGPVPFNLQSKVKFASGKFDTNSNDRIETEWTAWGKPGMCDFERRLSLADIQRLAIRTIACDGEVLIRVHEGRDNSPWGMQLQVLDTDRLDEDLNKELTNGNIIIAGVELDPDGRTVAYHLLKRKPRDWHLGGVTREYIRIPADEIIHLFTPLYAEQVRGVPWMFAAILKLHQTGAFEEAAIIAARVGASKMGFYEQNADWADGAPEGGAKVDSDGNYIQSAEPGEFGVVPSGYKFQGWDPNYPDAQVGPFLKSLLRGVASSLGVSYHSLANDLEAVNFSSARAGLLEERDMWMMIQQWLVEHFHETVYSRWLGNSLLRRKMPFPIERFDRYLSVYFQPRRWQWVDPSKDITANTDSVKLRVKSRTAVAAEQGKDIEDVFDELKREQDLAKEKGIDLDLVDQKLGGNNAQEEPDQTGE